MMQKHVLVMGLVDPSGNPRPRRIIELCNASGFLVSVASFPLAKDLPIERCYAFKKPSMLFADKVIRKLSGALAALLNIDYFTDKLYENRWGFQKVAHEMKQEKFDLIFVEDLQLLSLAFKIKGDAKIIFDAREYYPLQLENSLFWRLTEKRTRIRICQNYLHRCDAMMTVSPGLQNKYYEEFKVSPVLLRSMPNYVDNEARKVNPEEIRLVHHGVANYNRKLENIVSLMHLVDERFKLDFYLTGPVGYKNKLIDMAKGLDNIRFLPPVEFTEIIPTLNQYDIGLCFIYPSTFNLKYCLPHKLFEFIQSSLAVVSGPLPDVQGIIEGHDCGLVSENFSPEEMATLLNNLSVEDVERFKANSHKASQTLCYEEESKSVLSLIQRVLGA